MPGIATLVAYVVTQLEFTTQLEYLDTATLHWDSLNQDLNMSADIYCRVQREDEIVCLVSVMNTPLCSDSLNNQSHDQSS